MQIPTAKDADLIPESYQMRLMAWRDEFTRGYFEIGDIANEIIMANLKKGMEIEHSMIYSAIGRFCGKSARTVRDYAEVAAFFPENIRKEYDMLPFSHFRYAKSRGSEWEEVLNYSMEHPDASEDRLSYEFDVAAYHPAIIMNSDLSPESVAASVAEVESGVAASAPVAVGLSGIYVLANLVAQTERILSWKMNVETRQKLILALDGLKDVLKELSYNEKALKFDYDTKEAPQYWTP